MEKDKFVSDNLDLIYKKIDHLRADDYQNVTEADRQAFKEIVSALDVSKRNELFERAMTPPEERMALNKSIEQSFSLSEHLMCKSEELFGKNKDLAEKLDDQNIYYSANISNLYLSYDFLDKKQSEPYVNQAKETLQKLVSAKGKANKHLADALENSTVEFRIFDSEGIDGKYVQGNQDEVTVHLSKGCFSEENASALAMVISHELGHYVDSRGRPKNYQGHAPRGEEFFADAFALEVCSKAGYSSQRYIDNMNAFGDKISQKNNGKSNIFQERGNFLQQEQCKQAVLSHAQNNSLSK